MLLHYRVFYDKLMKQITDAQQDVKRAESIDHKHFVVGYLVGETVRQKEIFHNISGGTEEIGNALGKFITGVVEEGNEEKHQRSAHRHIAEKQEYTVRFLMVTFGNELFFLKTFINIFRRFTQVMDGIHSHMLYRMLHLMEGMTNFMKGVTHFMDDLVKIVVMVLMLIFAHKITSAQLFLQNTTDFCIGQFENRYQIKKNLNFSNFCLIIPYLLR